MKVDDTTVYEEELKMWEEYYGDLIENADDEVEKNLYRALLQEKRDAIWVYINAGKERRTWKEGDLGHRELSEEQLVKKMKGEEEK